MAGEKVPHLWERACERWPREICGCGLAVWRHWLGGMQKLDAIEHAVYDTAEGVVEAEYARLVVEAVGSALTEEAPRLYGYRLWRTRVMAEWNYPTTLARVAVQGPDARDARELRKLAFGPFPPADLSWGADVPALRRYLRSRITRPPQPRAVWPPWVLVDARGDDWRMTEYETGRVVGDDELQRLFAPLLGLRVYSRIILPHEVSA